VSDEFPGSLVLHPVALSSIALLVLNDHYVKEHYRGLVPGKLSDAAGIVLFPLLIVAICEVSRRLLRLTPWYVGKFGCAASVVATGVVFALVKTWPPASDFYRWGTGVAEWPVYEFRGAVNGHALVGLPSAHLIRDHSDLLVLPLLLLPLWVCSRRLQKLGATAPATGR
jgi:hypothetical protein